MQVDREQLAQRHQSRTTIFVALIGALGTVLAAIAGHWQGKEQGAEHQSTLERRLAESAAEIADLRQSLSAQAQKIAALQNGLKPGSQTSPSPIGATSEPNAKPGPQTNERVVNNLRFNLRACNAESSNIVCSFVVTNLEGDRNFELSFQSGMVDSNGEPHRAERIFGGRKLIASNADISLVTGVPTAFSFRFPGLAASVHKLALLEVKSRGFSARWEDVVVASP